MNETERLDRNRREERRVLIVAASYDVFTLGQLWERLSWMNYGRLSRTLLKWWREDGLLERMDASGTFRPGYVWSRPVGSFWPHEAVYRWIE